MKRMLVLLLLLCPVTAFAGGSILLDTRAANLAPGTKVRVEIGAEYRMWEMPPRPANATERVVRVPVTDDMIRYRAASTNRGLWQFTAGGAIPTPQMNLRFAKDFPPAVNGMRAKLFFVMKYTLDIPAQNGQAARTVTRDIETTLSAPEGNEPVTGCLRLEQVGTGIFVGVTPECATPLNRGSRPAGGK